MADNAPARAVRLAAAAGVPRTKLGLKPRPIDEARLEPAIQQARQMLSDAERSAAWAEGEAMTLEQAISYALAENDA